MTKFDLKGATLVQVFCIIYVLSFVANADDATFERRSLDDATFERRSLDDATFERRSLDDATFERRNLDDATFERRNLDDATFERRNLDDATFERRSLDDATFERRSLDDATFERRSLDDATFERRSLDDATFERRGLTGVGGGFNVIDVSKCPNARGDGKTDVTQAVQKSWNDTCHSLTPAKLLIPQGTWLTAALDFHGPCTAPQIVIEVQGTLQAKPDCGAFPGSTWINIMGVNCVTLNGGGTLHGNGDNVWRLRGVGEKGKPLPDSLVFAHLNNSVIENINLVNSKGFQMKVFETSNVTINNIHINAPEGSPNTDGIHIGRLKDIKITNSVIGGGDDCISIGDGSCDVTVTNVTCGPGHGISIGSLGRYVDEKDVRNVFVSNCTFIKTTNGARIKSFRESPPLQASNITYADLIMQDVFNPIIIDQNYVTQHKAGGSKVRISDVHFRNIRGTSFSNVAVSLNCSDCTPCEGVELTDIDFTYTGNNTVDKSLTSACCNAKTIFKGKQNPAPCKI